MNYIIITSINDITDAIKSFADLQDWHVVVIGDNKSIPYNYENVTYLTVENQRKLSLVSLKTTPYNHYSRKNIGYLYAMSKGADLIYDTDDDTLPYENWKAKEFSCNLEIEGCKYINPFSLYTEKKVWPRGLHLAHINDNIKYPSNSVNRKVGVWQGLIDNDSDFDAIYRLTNGEYITFSQNKPDIVIGEGCYAPFNTQSTLWHRDLRALMYVPISVNFRFTDILRGYVAQRLMWDHGYRLGFHKPNTYQIRNAHNFYKDFLGEISMYQSIPTVVSVLDSLQLKEQSLEEGLVTCYQALKEVNIVRNEELTNLTNWLEDLNKLNHI
jgi:hypothetical protein